MKWDTIQQLIRILAQMGGAALVTNGMLTEDMATQLTGGVMALASVAWWIFWESKRAPKP